MSSRTATVLVIFIVAIVAFCLASVFGAMTGPISILPNESDSGGILDNLSAITDSDDNYNSYGYDDSQDYSQSYSSDDSYSQEPQVETTTDDSGSSDTSGSVETTTDDSVSTNDESQGDVETTTDGNN